MADIRTLVVDLGELKRLAKKSNSPRGLLRLASKSAQEQHCTKDHRYNGWTNYETWNAALWMSNEEGSDSHYREMAQEHYDRAEASKYNTREQEAAHELSKAFKSDHEDALAEIMPENFGMFADLLNGALSEVDWYGIAENYIDDVDKE